MQQRFGRPPTETVTVTMRRRGGRWQVMVQSRAEGEVEWDHAYRDINMHVGDALEAVVTELQRRLL